MSLLVRGPQPSLELRTVPPLPKHEALLTLKCVVLESQASADKSHLARLLLFVEKIIYVLGEGGSGCR